MAKDSGRMSTRRADAVEGSKLDGATAKVTALEYVQRFKYQDGRDGGAALHVEYDIDGMDDAWDRNYSLGDSSRFEVLDDGDAVKGKLNKGSNAYIFFDHLETAIEKAGLDYDALLPEGSLVPLREFFEAGNQVVLSNVPYKTAGGDDKTMPVIAEIIVSNTKTRGSKKKAADDVDELELKTIGIIEQILAKADGPVKFADLPQAIYDLCKRDPEVKAMRQWAGNEKNISDESRSWTYNAKKRTLEA